MPTGYWELEMEGAVDGEREPKKMQLEMCGVRALGNCEQVCLVQTQSQLKWSSSSPCPSSTLIPGEPSENYA